LYVQGQRLVSVSEKDQKIREEGFGTSIMDTAICKDGFSKDVNVHCHIRVSKT